MGLLTSAQAAGVLGVRVSTVYAYVSRGVLVRTTKLDDNGRRTSWFDREEVLRIAGLRDRQRAGALSILVESDVTQLDPCGRLAFRGRDLDEILARGGFEAAAAVVCNESQTHEWPPGAPAITAAVDAARGWIDQLDRPSDRVRAAVTVAASADSNRTEQGTQHVLWVARQAVRVAIAGLSPVTPSSGRVADDLGFALLQRRLNIGERVLLDTVLTVLIDHELTASTFATRIAAGLHADPWSALLTGLHAMSGSRQAGAGSAAAEVLDQWLKSAVMPELKEQPPGFGRKVYENSDPRAEAVFEALAKVDPDLHGQVIALATEVALRHSLFPNIDLGLAAMARTLGMDAGATDAVFMVARIPGLAAHAIEEYPHPLRYRPRSV